MKPDAKRLEALGRAAAKAQDERTDAIVEEARARFVASTTKPNRKLSTARWLVLVAATLAISVVFWLRHTPAAHEALTFRVAARPGVVSEWVDADAEVPLQFSDGSTVLFGRGTRGNVAALGTTSARVRVERGAAVVSVSPRSSAQWTFDVGPFAVSVSGTRFDTSWEPKGEVFEIEVRDGSVKVVGPTIEGERALVAGQKLRIALAVSGELVTPPPMESALPPAPTASDAPKPAPKAQATSAWRDHAKAGRWAEALADAAPTFDALCAHESADDVMLLGDAARFGGDPTRATKAYTSVRARFAGASQAAVAAFALGRLATQDHAEQEAARWFETYGVEAPSGPRAREALGRAMEARERLGDGPTAKRHAAAYLAKYPEGPHARLAKKIAE